MELEKIRGLSDEELTSEEAKAAEQLFRIRFAKSLGKQEGVGKIQSLKLDIARFKTIAKERALAATATAGKA
jgi:large subunit ribosomal protein L29